MADSDFNIIPEDREPLPILKFSGHLEYFGHKNSLEKILSDILSDRGSQKIFLFDLSGLEYVDSFGLGNLLILMKEYKNRGYTFLPFGARGVVKELLSYPAEYKVISLFDTKEEAIEFVKSNR